MLFMTHLCVCLSFQYDSKTFVITTKIHEINEYNFYMSHLVRC